MILIQNCSTNGYAVTVWGVQGNTNALVVPAGGRIEVPGVVGPDGESYYGGMTVTGTVVAWDGASGQLSDILLERGPMGYAIDGGVLALTLGATVWVIGMVRRGVRVKEGYE